LKQSEHESKTTVSIPFNERLKDDDVDYIIKCVGELQK
jgi:dTDP-4-amino-4,6-dideoxygalactose transaminase